MKGRGFLEGTLDRLHHSLQQSLSAENAARSQGALQRIDPRVKLAGLLALIVAAALSQKLLVVAAVFGLALVLAALSAVPIFSIALATLTFSGALALPALFVTPGTVIYRMPEIHWAITMQGLRSAGFLILRAESAATLAAVLVFTTPWAHVLKALRLFRVPVVLVMILGMTCRYLLLLLETAREMFESRKSRTVGKLPPAEQRRIALETTGALLSRSLQLSGEVYLAMQARGFRGEVYILDDFEMRRMDWIAALGFTASTALVLWMGR